MKDFFGHKIELGDTVAWAINSVLVEGTVVELDGSRMVVEDLIGNRKIKMTYDAIKKVHPTIEVKQSVVHQKGTMIGYSGG